MSSDQLIMAEVFMNIAASFAVLASLAKILLGSNRTLVQNRLAFLLANLGIITALRAADELTTLSPFFKFLLFALTATIPLTSLIMAEGLLRRHAPLVLKLLSVGGALGLSVWAALADQPSSTFMFSLGGFELLMFASIVWIVSTAPASSLSDSEVRTLRSIGVVLLLCLPLVLTNLRDLLGWPIPRLGAIAILLLTVTMVRLTEKLRRRDVFMEIAFIFAVDLIGALVFCSVWGHFAMLPLVYPVCLAFHLFIIAFKELLFGNQDQVQDWIIGLIEEIDRSEPSNLGEIKRRAQEVINSQSLLILTEEDLADFNLVQLRQELESGQVKISPKASSSELSASQTDYLLESHQMTMIHAVSLKPLTLILVNNRSLGFSSSYSKEIALLRRYLSALMRNPA